MEEVAFQQGCQVAELRNVLTSALGQPQRKLSSMHSRIKKHLGATAPKLAAEVCYLRACHITSSVRSLGRLVWETKALEHASLVFGQCIRKMHGYPAWWLTSCKHNHERGSQSLSNDMLAHLCCIHIGRISQES